MSVGWIAAPAVAVLVMVFPTSHVMAEVEPLAVDVPSVASSYIQGTLLVKFTEEAVDAIERARKARLLPVVGDEALDTLFAKYGIAMIEPVVRPSGSSCVDVAKLASRTSGRAHASEDAREPRSSHPPR